MREKNILIVDDEEDILKILKLFLEKEGFNVYKACNGEEAYEIFLKYDIDLVVLDIMMPKLDGYEVIKRIRKQKQTPIIVISAKVQLGDVVLGLDIGADDYVLKPFEPLEIVARVKAQLRKFDKNEKNNLIVFGDITLDTEKCKVFILDKDVDLTKGEIAILECLMKRPGKVFTKEEIYQAGWGDGIYAVDDNTIRVAVSRIRDKIGKEKIKTIRGLGYRLERNE